MEFSHGPHTSQAAGERADRGAMPSPLVGVTGQTPAAHTPHYYERLGTHHDGVLRCEECHRLVTHAALVAEKGCPGCGGRRVLEVRALTFREWLRIRLGLLRFPYRHEFLQEFSRGR